MTFSSGQDMYDALDFGDIYNSEKELYIFLYNDAGAVCVYNVSKYEAKELELMSKKSGEYWGSVSWSRWFNIRRTYGILRRKLQGKLV